MFEVITDYPIALESPDHIKPCGAMHDNNTSAAFIREFKSYAESQQITKPYFIMDLGCASGRFIVDCLGESMRAIGLEGSDYMLKHGLYYWPDHKNNLFTCNVAKKFEVYYDGIPTQFDLITAWEVMEHFKVDELPIVLENIGRHLRGLFICSIAQGPHVPYHQCYKDGIKSPEWWDELFSKYGFVKREDLKRHFKSYVRGGGGFHRIFEFKK